MRFEARVAYFWSCFVWNLRFGMCLRKNMLRKASNDVYKYLMSLRLRSCFNAEDKMS